jgi:ankyrin repeat protein
VDPRGRTPLHLAVTLGHLESVRVLLRHDANANAENSRYWTGKMYILHFIQYLQDLIGTYQG